MIVVHLALPGALCSMDSVAPATTIDQLLDRYGLLLLDAYGVLLDKQGPLPGAVELIARLNREQHPYFVVTNSASRLPETFANELQQIGLEIAAAQIITSGGLLVPYFSAHRLTGCRCVVLGPENSAEYVRRAGGMIVHWSEDAEVVVIADQAGIPLLEALNGVVTTLLRRFDRGDNTTLLLCNPDRIYPVASESYGVTAGSLAHLIEGILHERYPEANPSFTRLGKPHSPIFKAAIGSFSREDCIMIGDQPDTDILGANRFGIDSALVMTGLAQSVGVARARPTYLLNSLK